MPVRFKTVSGTYRVNGHIGDRLSDLAVATGMALNMRCAGLGNCHGCAVELGPGRYQVGAFDVDVGHGESHAALACQVQLLSTEAEITVPSSSLVETGAKIDDDFVLAGFREDPQARMVQVEVPRPTLGDPASDLERLNGALRRRIGEPVRHAPIEVARHLPRALAAGDQRVTVTLSRAAEAWELVEVEAGETDADLLGLAVDIGTTTVVAMLVDLAHCLILAKASLYNQQLGLADDVAARISYATGDEQVAELQRRVVDDTVNVLIDKLCRDQEVAPTRIVRVAVAGNTVMTHLFLGISPETIGRIPFQPAVRELPPQRAARLGIGVHPQALVDVVPAVAGYIGGDIVADLHAAGLRERGELTMLLDIGTNGEMVLSENGTFRACATAAGPAFEGAGITHGCRAATGAIEHLHFGADLDISRQVIGGGRPTGICGSAVVDFLAHGLRAGLLNRMGRLDVARLRAAGRYAAIPARGGDLHACIVAHGAETGTNSPLTISEHDIAQLLKAKAATYAGMKSLLGTAGRTFADIRRFVLAGGFARHIDLQNAICIGILPELPLDRFDILGNGSLAGAFLTLVDASAAAACSELIALPEVVELNLVEDFEQHFVDALALPNLVASDFPRVTAELRGQQTPAPPED